MIIARLDDEDDEDEIDTNKESTDELVDVLIDTEAFITYNKERDLREVSRS